jgi:hypothetical protein
MVMYAIVVEQQHDLPSYVRVGEQGHLSTSIINPPPEEFQYSDVDLPRVMAMLKRDYPEAFIAAHEVEYIDHEQMTHAVVPKDRAANGRRDDGGVAEVPGFRSSLGRARQEEVNASELSRFVSNSQLPSAARLGAFLLWASSHLLG